MATYYLRIELEVEAASPEDAVREGEAILEDAARLPFVWEVSTGSTWRSIAAEDLEKPDGGTGAR
jgi:hypothetical protein